MNYLTLIKHWWNREVNAHIEQEDQLIRELVKSFQEIEKLNEEDEHLKQLVETHRQTAQNYYTQVLELLEEIRIKGLANYRSETSKTKKPIKKIKKVQKKKNKV